MTQSLSWRLFRLLLPIAALTTVWACQDHPLAPPAPFPSRQITKFTTINPSSKLDVVFMIDNSPSMIEEQTNLIRNFPAFMQELQNATPAGTLDVHIGVISSDLGAGDQATVCKAGGDNGTFQHQPRGNHGACKALPRGSFIIAGPGGNNFDGPIEDVFSCIAELGTNGCGLEHQLASLRRALGGDPTTPMPAENAGFLRADARLGVVLISDEDDCSAPPDTDLFTGERDKLTDRYGALESYRCNEFGHLCGGSPPPRKVDVTLQDCESNETPSTRLIPVGDMVKFFHSLKPNASDLVVATITGPNMPYGTELSAPNELSGANERYVKIKPACSSANGTADPAVRLQQFTKAFGANGITRSICTDTFAQVMRDIAIIIAPSRNLCIDGRLVDSDTAQPGVQADCVVARPASSGAAPSAETVIPACERNGNAPPCWSVQANPTKCPAPASPESMEIKVDWGSAGPPSNAPLRYSCAVCIGADGNDPRCARP
ncbi:MAG TPA: hypothetical protein VNO55_01790 [Polyangia bacterium]|nr:hypothetical protein [Polyangia bacterium]